ncbi:hypothetical protein EMIT047CA2_210020 [Pseudomonas soli]
MTSDKEQRCCDRMRADDELRGFLRVKTTCFRSRPLHTGLALPARRRCRELASSIGYPTFV